LDGEHDSALVKEEIFSGKEFSLYLSMKLFDTVLIRFSQI
jgi:hypothetical protein